MLFFPFFFSLSHSRTAPPLFSFLHRTQRHPTTFPLPPIISNHHHTVTAPSPRCHSAFVGPSFILISPFPFLLTETQIPLKSIFLIHFRSFEGIIPLTGCAPCCYVVNFDCLQGVRLICEGVPKPFDFGVPTKCSVKSPNVLPACLGGKVHLFDPLDAIARPPIESQKLILETSFAIKDEFPKNEATEWAVQELKRRGLKRLFKPFASTAYERLVRAFYEHLRYDCNWPDVLVSSINDRDVELTIANVAAVLKCSHEPPKSDVPWIDCLSMLTLKDIVSDMCEGQYTDKHRNAASKAKIPRNLWFIDVVLCIGTCVLWDTRNRGRTFFP
jgi:hypothetical protein